MSRYTDVELTSSAAGEDDGPASSVLAGGGRRRVWVWGGLATVSLLAATAVFVLTARPGREPATSATVDLSSLAADFASAAEFPNIHLVASGYNIFYADPTPKMDLGSDVVNIDPGMRKPVFKIEYNEQRLTGDRRHRRPDGYFATVDYGCSEVFSTKTISDDYSMTTERNIEASITDQAGLDVDAPPTVGTFEFSHGDTTIQDTGGAASLGAFVGGSGTLSGSYQHIKETNMFKDSRLVQSSAKCAVYTAGIAYGFPPEIDPDFKAKADGAASNSEWWEVFDEFGTHFLSNIQMGARFGSMMIFNKDHYEAMTSEVAEAGFEVGPVIEAGVKTAVSNPDIEDLLMFEFAPSLKLPDVPLVNQQAVTKVTSHASAHVFQGVGPQMPPGGAAKWIDEVSKNPVPMRFSKMEICAHPGLSSSQRSECVEAMEVYCDQYLKAKGAICEPPENRQCQMDGDCEQGHVCRSFKCEEVPVCYVSVYNRKGYSGQEYALDPVTSVAHPSGKAFTLRIDNWYKKIESFKMGTGCKQVKLYDDDSGSVFLGWPEDKTYTTSQSSLIYDLEHDVRMIEVWANDVPGTPPFEPGSGVAASDLPRPEKIAFDPAKDTLFAEPKKSAGLNSKEGDEFFANIGKAMYGYNHFHGSPFSTKFAGSDPGFQGRSVWKTTYDGGNVGVEATWSRMPMAPIARYFVLFAQKHPNLKQIQEDVKDPSAAGVRYLRTWKEDLERTLQNMKDGKVDFGSWVAMYTGKALTLHRVTQPEVPNRILSDEYCALQQSNTELRQSIIDEGYQKYQAQFESTYARYYYDEDRRLDDVEELHHEWYEQELDPLTRRLHAVGDIICQGGSVKTWTKADQDKKMAELRARYGYYDDVRRLSAEDRRLSADDHIDTSEWFSVQARPNIREFASLARAKQALRSEARCIGKFNREECPSGADYDLNVDGTAWDVYYDDSHLPEGREVAVSKKLRKEWPRFIVKVVNDSVSDAEIELIDGQNQRKGWRSGFDSVLPNDTHWMLDFLKAHVAANPVGSKVMEAETALAMKVPDGWKVTRSKGGPFCEQDMKTDTVTDAHSFEKLTSSSIGIPNTGGAIMGNGGSFGLSYEKKELMKNQGQKGEKMVATQAECGAYYAELVDLEGDPPETEPSFAFLVEKAEEDAHFWIIFDLYGLHFPTEVVFGARYGASQFIKESKFMEYHRTEEALDLEFAAEVSIPTKTPGVAVGMKKDASIGYSGTDEEKRVVDKYFEERRVFSIGKRIPEGGMDAWAKDIGGEPMPIKFGLETLCKHPAFKAKEDACAAASSTYCEKYLKRKHPELECEGSRKSECLWAVDCDGYPNVRCTQGMCISKPKCEVQIFDQTNFQGSSYLLGPVYYHDYKPYEIVDLAHVAFGSFRGKVRSLKMSGGCSKMVRMTTTNLDGGSSSALTNHKDNEEKQLADTNYYNFIAMYPKEFFVDEGSQSLQDER